MAATPLGTTGNWGIPQAEAGVIIYDLGFDYSIQDKPVLDPSGEIQGLVLYQPLCELKLSGLVAKESPFASKLGTVLAIANAMPSHLPSDGGTTVITNISRNLNNEDFEKIDITARHYPSVAAA